MKSLYLVINDKAEAALSFHNCTPVDYMIDGKTTARPLYTREQVDEMITTALKEQTKTHG